jgi:kynureninase
VTNYALHIDYARQMDANDPLHPYRDRFFFPQHNGRDAIYFTGNSLGLQPKTVQLHLEQELHDWSELGVEGHVKAKNPWVHYHHRFSAPLARLVGANDDEVVAMNTLSVNLNLMMVSFYRPTAQRFKIMVEGQLFPSDHYAVEGQLRFHGFDPEDGIIELVPRPGEHYVRTEDILESIHTHRDTLALILLGGVNYYTGQLFDMPAITNAGHKAGAMVAFDLAHAIGNIPLNLHKWGVDWAAWCTYKYLNSGPGAVGGVFIHRRHLSDPAIPRFNGWWGYREEDRFKMEKGFVPMPGAAAWQNSNAPVFNMAAHKASLDIFDEVGMVRLREKSVMLTGYLEYCIERVNAEHDLGLTIITPRDTRQRGCQLSVLTGDHGRQLFDKLRAGGVIADWRHPNVIRLAPAPLYNSFEDVYRFAEILAS